MINHALVIIGSGKRPRSTSAALGGALVDRLGERGTVATTVDLHRLAQGDDPAAVLIDSVRDADLVVLSFPLYFDALPAVVTQALETLAAAGPDVLGGTRLAAIVNCGFPEAEQNTAALAICRRFCVETGVEWLGGLSLGGGEAVSGRSLESMGKMAHRIGYALEQAADALAEARAIPSSAFQIMAHPLISPRLYTLLGSVGWLVNARRNRCMKSLGERPYLHEEE